MGPALGRMDRCPAGQAEDVRSDPDGDGGHPAGAGPTSSAGQGKETLGGYVTEHRARGMMGSKQAGIAERPNAFALPCRARCIYPLSNGSLKTMRSYSSSPSVVARVAACLILLLATAIAADNALAEVQPDILLPAATADSISGPRAPTQGVSRSKRNSPESITRLSPRHRRPQSRPSPAFQPDGRGAGISRHRACLPQ